MHRVNRGRGGRRLRRGLRESQSDVAEPLLEVLEVGGRGRHRRQLGGVRMRRRRRERVGFGGER